MSETIAAFAARLIAAHDGAPLIDTVPDHLVPADAAGAYALQDEIIGQIGTVGGWKILAGASALSCSPIPANRFVLAEVEIAVKLGADLGADADAAAVEAAIASLHPILEMVASPFVDRDAIAANAKMGDLQSNGCVIVGPALDPAIKTELTTLPVRLLLDGTEAKAATAGASWATIVEALRWLASHAAARGLPLSAGQVIITGARALAPHAPAALVVGDLGKWGKVSASMTY
jgi:2-keto-4-pentenoate hydratase